MIRITIDIDGEDELATQNFVSAEEMKRMWKEW